MSIKLYGYGGNRNIARKVWLNLVDLARESRWEPDEREFDSNYVEVQDAKLLADALANAVAGNHAETASDESAEFKAQLVEFFNGPNKRALLNDLIPFFRAGAFRFRDE